MNPAPIAQPLAPVAEPVETVEQLATTDPDEMIDELLTSADGDKLADDMPDQWLQSTHNHQTSHMILMD